VARRLTSLSKRAVVVVLAVHAVLLPVLYFALAAVIEKNMAEAFIDDARVQARIVADTLELDPNVSESVLVAQLDSAVLGGRIVHASVLRSDGEIMSSLMTEEDLILFDEDFEFGEHDDSIYYLALPVVTGSTMANLHLGFDESLTQSNFEEVQQSLLMLISAYLLIVVVAAILLSSALTRPLRWLQDASRTIAHGDYHKQLATDSRLREINELTQDLEQMRSNLVKVNARLQHAQRLESLGTLAGGVAHEFNNVLQPMLLYTDLAIEDLPKDSHVADNMRRVLELGHRAKGLSQQILTFSRMGDEAQFSETPLRPVVEEAVTMIRALLPATLKVRADLKSDVGLVRCDPAQIQQLIVNLCNNAYRAMAETGGHITVSLQRATVGPGLAARHPHLEVGEYAELKVADTGCGMDEETVARVFEPFFTTQGVGEGTGLGLSVVHGIVRRHDAEIMLTSEPGKGTTFRVYLPIVAERRTNIRENG
jgi:signal transduction histidine kinase